MHFAVIWNDTHTMAAVVNQTNISRAAGCVDPSNACWSVVFGFVHHIQSARVGGVKIFWRVVQAVCNEYKIEFPFDNKERLRHMEAEFRSRWEMEAMQGCVGCIDGLLIKIRAPTKAESACSKRFHSRKNFFAVMLRQSVMYMDVSLCLKSWVVGHSLISKSGHPQRPAGEKEDALRVLDSW
ncbi:hypothetical protein AAMO2058_000684000 [Amorphochlora amoebiformis]